MEESLPIHKGRRYEPIHNRWLADHRLLKLPDGGQPLNSINLQAA